MNEPFLRPASTAGATLRPAPGEWVTAPLGTWRGRPVEVVYDPRTHDVAVFRAVTPAITAALANTGWRLRGSDGGHQWWSRRRSLTLAASSNTTVGRAARRTAVSR